MSSDSCDAELALNRPLTGRSREHRPYCENFFLFPFQTAAEYVIGDWRASVFNPSVSDGRSAPVTRCVHGIREIKNVGVLFFVLEVVNASSLVCLRSGFSPHGHCKFRFCRAGIWPEQTGTTSCGLQRSSRIFGRHLDHQRSGHF